MKDKNPIETKIETALASINNIKRAQPSIYFFSKILNKLERPKERLIDKWNALLLNPSLAFVSLVLILTINVVAIFYNQKKSKLSEATTVAITEEYSQSTTPSFYLETSKP